MPTTVEALLVLFFAITPGIPGDKMYRALVGADWRQKDWESILRLLLISALGLALYSISAKKWGWPAPIYVTPETFRSGGISPSNLYLLFVPYIGHLVGATFAGLLVGGGQRLLLTFYPFRSLYPAAWNQFIRSCVHTGGSGRWVLVTLNSGDVYVGFVTAADISVAANERDIILGEPAKYDEQQKNYLALPYQQIFLPASLVTQIAVLYDPGVDTKRLTPVGKPIFKEYHNNDQRETDAADAERDGQPPPPVNGANGTPAE
jgi:hypothetical protein